MAKRSVNNAALLFTASKKIDLSENRASMSKSLYIYYKKGVQTQELKIDFSSVESSGVNFIVPQVITVKNYFEPQQFVVLILFQILLSFYTSGRVVTMTGSTGLLAPPGYSAFSMSQFSLEAMCDSLRAEMSPFNVKVITVRPGNFFGATGMLNRTGVGLISNLCKNSLLKLYESWIHKIFL